MSENEVVLDTLINVRHERLVDRRMIPRQKLYRVELAVESLHRWRVWLHSTDWTALSSRPQSAAVQITAIHRQIYFKIVTKSDWNEMQYSTVRFLTILNNLQILCNCSEIFLNPTA